MPSSASACAWPESEHVRALRLELLVRHLDDLDLALLEQVEQPHGRDTRVHEGEVAVERGDERHEVQDLAAPVPVREVEVDHVDTRERVGERGDGGLVRAVADPDEECSLVEPHRVAALHEHGR